MAKRATLSDFAAKKPVTEQTAETTLSSVTRGGEGVSKKIDDRKGQTLRLSMAAWRQLKIMAVEEGVPVHDILVEAVNESFRKRGKPPIA